MSVVDAAPGARRVGRAGVAGGFVGGGWFVGDGWFVAQCLVGSASLWMACEPYVHSPPRHN